MNLNWMIGIAALGVLSGIISMVAYNDKIPNQPPLAVSYNPYASGLFATGIIESDQPTGTNIDIFPSVSGIVTHIFVKEGQIVEQGEPLLKINSDVQQAIVAKDQATVRLNEAALKNLEAQHAKYVAAQKLNPRSVSRNDVDQAKNAVIAARKNVAAASKQYLADRALLEKFTVKSPDKVKVLRISTAVGDYIAPRGGYNSYNNTLQPPVQLALFNPSLVVRCYLNEILVPSLPKTRPLEATLFVRGLNNKSIPLEFVGLQPYAQPSLRLNNPNNRRVDARALPILFRFAESNELKLYPGQYVDVYIRTS